MSRIVIDHSEKLLDFRIYIESLGFEHSNIGIYKYKGYIIDSYHDHYDFYNGSIWTYYIKLNDLRPLENYFKQEMRRIKLKRLL